MKHKGTVVALPSPVTAPPYPVIFGQAMPVGINDVISGAANGGPLEI